MPVNGVVLRDVHVAWAWVVVIGNGLAGLWALAAHRWPAVRSRALWWFTGVAEISLFVQVILGVVMVTAEDYEPPEFHMFYGFVALIAVAIIYSYRSQMAKHRYLLYGVGGLFLMGLGIRAMVVGNAAMGG